jgi:inhibitor of cysteine peptidase
VALASGCSASTAPQRPATPSAVHVTAEADGGTVDLVVGQELVVELPGNPSTGYTWMVTSLPSVLATAGEPAFSSESASGVVGAGGTISTTFNATGAGTGRLEMGYSRPWETGVPAEKTFATEIRVK